MENPWQTIEYNIIDQYLNDLNQRPWMIAFSGGKDSTTLLQVLWNSLSKIEPNKRTRDIYVVCNNTLVENPVIISYVKTQLELIKSAAKEQSLPITVKHTIIDTQTFVLQSVFFLPAGRVSLSTNIGA